jgi:tetratricopeptide (TPR) repeat protein
MAMRRSGRRLVLLALLAVTAGLAGSCAFYNTYYFARKNYDLATGGQPYEVDPNPLNAGTSAQYYRKSIDYSKKLIANYPTSKWVDDAYVMWARSLLGTNDPIQTISMLRDFPTRYPQSSLKSDAAFYLAVAQRQAHKYSDALASLDDFLASSPKHKLMPYAELERARVLRLLDRDAEAADAAGRAVAKLPKGRLQDIALAERAEARLDSHAYEEARADFHALGERALSDDERFNLLLREADCLEQARSYDATLALLHDALVHEHEPARSDTLSRTAITVTTSQPGSERWGRLMLRMGNIYTLQGRRDEALRAYQEVIGHFARQPLAAEAQYRIGYLYETVADDFESARIEYAKVKTQSQNSAYTAQAAQRAANLERLSTFRAAGGDTTEKRAEGAFMLAEQYLFELDKPDRALAVYDSIARAYQGTPWGAKAINAQAWVMREKFNRDSTADSLLWQVVHEYPATEGQLAARDYLEARGHNVPESLIQLPAPPTPPVAEAEPDTLQLTQPPTVMPSLGGPIYAYPSLGGITPSHGGAPPPVGLHEPPVPEPGSHPAVPGTGLAHPYGAPSATSPDNPDTLGHGGAMHQPGASPGGPLPVADSLKVQPPPPMPAPSDTTHH